MRLFSRLLLAATLLVTIVLVTSPMVQEAAARMQSDPTSVRSPAFGSNDNEARVHDVDNDSDIDNRDRAIATLTAVGDQDNDGDIDNRDREIAAHNDND